MNAYKLLLKKCDHFIKSYRDDLIKHDKNDLADYDGEFIHITRESGTYLMKLIPADQFPDRGIYVDYLFGRADRHHLLDQVDTPLCHILKNYIVGQYMIHHYRHGVLKKIDMKEALALIDNYKERIRKDWLAHLLTECGNR